MKTGAAIFLALVLSIAGAAPVSAATFVYAGYGTAASSYVAMYDSYAYLYDYSYYAPTYYSGISYNFYKYSQPTYFSAYQQPTYYQPQTNYYGSQYDSSTPSPDNYHYRTGDTDTFGYDMCYWEGYGRGRCDFNPRQPVYDFYTGTWY